MAFRTMYYGPMDRQDAPPSDISEQRAIEEPIFPINQLGETVPESLGQRNIIQTTQAAIRGGAGTLQLVLRAPPDSIGPTSVAARIGKEVREALREVRMANDVRIVGAEMPTSMRGLSGFDVQRENFSEENRLRNLDAIRDSVKFVGDVNGGGGVDILSWEFARSVNDAAWNEDENFERKTEVEGRALLVEPRSGGTIKIQKEESLHAPVDRAKWELKEEPGAETVELTWKDLGQWAKANEKRNEAAGIRSRFNPDGTYNEKYLPETPEEVWAKIKIDEQVNNLLGSAVNSERIARAQEQEKALKQSQLDSAADEELKKRLQEDVNRLDEEIRQLRNSAQSSRQQVAEQQARRLSFRPINEYGLKKSAQTYAEAGGWAMKETEEGMARGTVTKPLYIGPENGWPDWFGGHPDEFIKLIKESRKEMVNMLTKKKYRDADGKEQVSKFYDPRISKKQAEKIAKQHVKGLFDTSHMGMWFKHFTPKKDPKTGKLETEDHRIKRFNKWFTGKVEQIAKEDIVGGIQLVDSGSGEHGHLPPGEGIFPVIETAEIFKKHGYGGFLVSEGHEEERFGQGRIRTKLWQKAAGKIPSHGYFAGGGGPGFPQQMQSYFGRTYSPLFMFGSYSPSNEFKLWSDVPLE